MDMRFCRTCDSQSFCGGCFEVLIDTATRVNNDRFAGALATNHIRGMSEGLVVKVF
jgi:hypothetical protein